MAYPYPSIDGVDLPLALLEGPLRDAHDDRSTVLAGRVRSRRKGRLQLWLAWEWTFFGTAERWAVARALLAGDGAGEFTFRPRGLDPYLARCASPLPALTPLYLRDGAGRRLHRVEVRVEAVEVAHAWPAPPPPLVTDADGALLTDADGVVLTY